MLNLNDSKVYRAWVEEAQAQGRAEGRAEEARRILVRVGARRLGSASAAVQDRLAAIDDVDTLEALADRVLDVQSWDELLTP